MSRGVLPLLETVMKTWRVRSRGRSARGGQVIVVGAGLAGVAAARELQSAGWEVVVLEARDRIGGRIWTDRSFGVPVDLGAAWIHRSRGNPLTALTHELGVPTRVTDFEDASIFDLAGRPVDEALVTRVRGKAMRVLGAVTRLSHSIEQDMSVMDGIRQVMTQVDWTPEEEMVFRWLLAKAIIAAAADMEASEDFAALSLKYFDDDEEFAGEDRTLPDGFDRLVECLARGLDIRLCIPVRRITVHTRGVRVETDQGVIDADVVITTLPLGVLQAETVVFDPPLPPWKQTAIQRLRMGVLNKLVLQFPEVFWPVDREFVEYLSDDPGGFPLFWNPFRSTGIPILVGYTGGRRAWEMEAWSDEAIVEQAMQVLRRIFGLTIPSPTAIRVTRWHRDPYARGAYSYIPVGGRGEDYEAMAEPVGERLLFAGEATIRAYPGTVHGAYLSGIREARRLLRVQR